MKKSESMLGVWAAAGVVLGSSFGLMMDSFVVGIPIGLSASFLTGVVVDRLAPRITKYVKQSSTSP